MELTGCQLVSNYNTKRWRTKSCEVMSFTSILMPLIFRTEIEIKDWKMIYMQVQNRGKPHTSWLQDLMRKGVRGGHWVHTSTPPQNTCPAYRNADKWTTNSVLWTKNSASLLLKSLQPERGVQHKWRFLHIHQLGQYWTITDYTVSVCVCECLTVVVVGQHTISELSHRSSML